MAEPAAAKAAVPWAGGKKRGGDSIQQAMDALEEIWNVKDELDDEEFFEIDFFEDT